MRASASVQLVSTAGEDGSGQMEAVGLDGGRRVGCMATAENMTVMASSRRQDGTRPTRARGRLEKVRLPRSTNIGA